MKIVCIVNNSNYLEKAKKLFKKTDLLQDFSEINRPGILGSKMAMSTPYRSMPFVVISCDQKGRSHFSDHSTPPALPYPNLFQARFDTVSQYNSGDPQ